MAEIIKLDGTTRLDFDRETVEHAYDRWAPIYDLVFGGVFSKGRRAAILGHQQHRRPRARGRRRHRHFAAAIRAAPPHLRHRHFGGHAAQGAGSALPSCGLKNVEGLAVMDAEKLEFADNSFDVVMAQYVVTAVPNPEAALDEFARVLRPGGEMIMLSRVSADAGMRRFIEQRLQPVVRPLGFRTAEFSWSRYAKWLAERATAWNWSSAARFRRSAISRWSVSARSTSPRPPDASCEPAVRVVASLPTVICHYDDVTRRTSNRCNMNPKGFGGRMIKNFLQELRTQRWDDHRYYHHSRINQSLHFVSASAS